MKIEFVDAETPPTEATALAVLAFEDGELSPAEAVEHLQVALAGVGRLRVKSTHYRGAGIDVRFTSTGPCGNYRQTLYL